MADPQTHVRRLKLAVPARIGAGLAALCAWTGLWLQTLAAFNLTHSVVLTAFAMARYFTILTNLAFAILMTSVAAGFRPRPGWLGGVTISMLTVGIVYALLLHGFMVLPGLGRVANVFLHQAAPAAAGLFWAALAPKGELRRRHAWIWLAILTGYGAYALVRGVFEGSAVYPFLDPAKGGWSAVFVTVSILGCAFMLASQALIELDRRMACWRQPDKAV